MLHINHKQSLQGFSGTMFHVYEWYEVKGGYFYDRFLSQTINFGKNVTTLHRENCSWEANSRWAIQKIPHFLWNLEVQYHLHTICPLISILSQFTPVHISDLQQNSLPFIEPGGSLTPSHQLSTYSYPQPIQFSPCQ